MSKAGKKGKSSSVPTKLTQFKPEAAKMAPLFTDTTCTQDSGTSS